MPACARPTWRGSRICGSRTADSNVELAAKAWREQLAALGELVLVGDAASAEAAELAAERAEAARAKLEAARAARSQAEAAAKAVADAQARVQMCAAEVEHHGGALREVDAELAVVAKAIERTRGERDSRVERMAELAAQLAGAGARWNVVAGEPERMRRAVVELVATWRRHAGDVVLADAELAGALQAAERERLTAEREVAEAAAREAGLVDEARDRAAELAVAADALDAARAEAGFDAGALRRLLADGPARAEALAEQLARIARSLDRAHALVREHARLVAEHECHEAGRLRCRSEHAPASSPKPSRVRSMPPHAPRPRSPPTTMRARAAPPRSVRTRKPNAPPSSTACSAT